MIIENNIEQTKANRLAFVIGLVLLVMLIVLMLL